MKIIRHCFLYSLASLAMIVMASSIANAGRAGDTDLFGVRLSSAVYEIHAVPTDVIHLVEHVTIVADQDEQDFRPVSQTRFDLLKPEYAESYATNGQSLIPFHRRC